MLTSPPVAVRVTQALPSQTKSLGPRLATMTIPARAAVNVFDVSGKRASATPASARTRRPRIGIGDRRRRPGGANPRVSAAADVLAPSAARGAARVRLA